MKKPASVLTEVMEFDNQEHGGSRFEPLGNRWTGFTVPEPGPNMMWNANYGHMGAGMLGVHGCAGWVWYHEWHGNFLGMKEIEEMK